MTTDWHRSGVLLLDLCVLRSLLVHVQRCMYGVEERQRSMHDAYIYMNEGTTQFQVETKTRKNENK